MAAPITHIALSNKVFDSHFSHFSKKKFFIGTSFPDIRYLKVIDRDKTHHNNVSLQEIKKSDAFKAGLQFHSLVDIVREKYLQEANIYDIIPQSKFVIESIKLFEDEMLYRKIEDWDTIGTFFEDILKEELDFQIKKEDIIKWHNFLMDYFLKKPSREGRKEFFKSINFADDGIEQIEQDIKYMRENRKVEEIINRFYVNFEKLLNTINIFG